MSHTRPVPGRPEWTVKTLGARAYVYRAGVFTGYHAGDVYAAGVLARELAAESPPVDDYSV